MATARIVKEHAVRRNEILDSAWKMVYSKGYDLMTIQDILDDLRIAKGTFYHYFDSKVALLESLIERMLGDVEKVLVPIVEDPHLPALEKLQSVFATVALWKTGNKPFLISLLRAWYTDDNIIARHKARATGSKLVSPLLTAIIIQGTREGVFNTSYPGQAAELVSSIGRNLEEKLAESLLSADLSPEKLPIIELTIAAHTDAIERVLGIPSGSLHLVDIETLKAWAISETES